MSERRQLIKRAPKNEDHPYRMIDRSALEDKRLSFEARGALGFILVKPDHWSVNVTNLMDAGGIGRDKAYRIINEWITFGYCERMECRTSGRITGIDYVIHESPLPEKPDTVLPDTVLPDTVLPDTENQDHSNKEVVVIKNSSNKEVVVIKNNNNNNNNSRRDRRSDPAYDAICSDLENNGFGTMTSIMAKLVDELMDTYPHSLIEAAILIAVRSGSRNLSYVAGILRNQQSEGMDGGKTHASNSRNNPNDRANTERESPNAHYNRLSQ